MTTNETRAQRTQADKDLNAFMTFCVACFFLLHFAVSVIDSMIIA